MFKNKTIKTKIKLKQLIYCDRNEIFHFILKNQIIKLLMSILSTLNLYLQYWQPFFSNLFRFKN